MLKWYINFKLLLKLGYLSFVILYFSAIRAFQIEASANQQCGTPTEKTHRFFLLPRIPRWGRNLYVFFSSGVTEGYPTMLATLQISNVAQEPFLTPPLTFLGFEPRTSWQPQHPYPLGHGTPTETVSLIHLANTTAFTECAPETIS